MLAPVCLGGIMSFWATGLNGYLIRVVACFIVLGLRVISTKPQHVPCIIFIVVFVVAPFAEIFGLYQQREKLASVATSTSMAIDSLELQEYALLWFEKFAFFLVMQILTPLLFFYIGAQSYHYFGVLLTHILYG